MNLSITSMDNPQVKLVKSLQERRSARRKNNLFIIEGPNLIEEAVKSGHIPEKVFYTQLFMDSTENATSLKAVVEAGAIAIMVSEAVMADMSDTKNSQGILAIVPFMALPVPQNPELVLILDGVADPGNLGTIMRSALAAGADLLVTTSGTVDVTNPKVVRSAAGAHFRLPMMQLSWEGIASRFESYLILLADSGSGSEYYNIDWQQPIALIVSEEAHGPSDSAQRVGHARVKVPMTGKVESLNVAMATTIMLFEAARQRAVSGS